ncbi:winged helix-turn-helix transcriptional regulator [Streptomyces marincola]|uniref:winged helix-turn-helix transcriptional regulator n=1 Tax=Streptomyces marincola TaxID=2878388 RepID=UPI001CF29DE8|nr:helix-turn-helix domain-containing protein [Streptomyces marincola]UCM87927.1 helix-turn-helix transcriptional regulator [Streptomyces marincola]
MARKQLTDVACSIARATDVFGDAWTALIMRDVLLGCTRFDDLAQDLGISRKVLAARLNRLVDEDVLRRVRYQDSPPRHDYQPTEKGRELCAVLLALMAWGDRWYGGQDGPPLLIRHLDCGERTTAVSACAHCGGALTSENTNHEPGPGGRAGPGTLVLAPMIEARFTGGESAREAGGGRA